MVAGKGSGPIGLELPQCKNWGEAKVSEAKRKRNVRGMNANRLHHRPYARTARVNRMGASDQEFRSHVIFFHRLNRDSNQDWPLF